MRLPPFQAVLDAHRADVYRFVVASVGPSEADDVFQEACIAALRAYPRLESTANLRGWLLRIAQRKAIDAHRARGRRAVPVGDPPVRPASPAEVNGTRRFSTAQRRPPAAACTRGSNA